MPLMASDIPVDPPGRNMEHNAPRSSSFLGMSMFRESRVGLPALSAKMRDACRRENTDEISR